MPEALSPIPLARASFDEEFDVVVVGGGVNGTGIARDFALRGLRVELFERNDIAFGASGNSSGMIHGGVRYMLEAPSVTASSCRDSGYIQRIAPNLLFRIPFLMPLRAGAQGRVMVELIDAFFRAYDDYQPLKRGERHCRLDASDVARLEPGLAGAYVGGVTFDEWGVDGARLCVLNAIDAIEHGARVRVHTTVESVERAQPGGDGHRGPRYVVSARDRETGAVTRAGARVVVNATGAWSPITAALAHLPEARARVRPGKGIHVVLDRRITNVAILSKAIDGRQVFLYPWENVTVLGTTDDDYYGDLDEVRATSEEVRYLVQGVAKVFPGVRDARAIGTYAGVRPTLYAYGPTEDALSRDHRAVDHAPDGAPGVYSMIGGKLASYRLFAQELSDVVAPRDFGVQAPCTTHERPLPGGEREIRRARPRRGERRDARGRAAARLPARHARPSRARPRRAPAAGARRRVPVRAGARGRGAVRGPRGARPHDRRRRAAHAPRARGVRRHALRRAVRANRGRGARARAGRRARDGARLPRAAGAHAGRGARDAAGPPGGAAPRARARVARGERRRDRRGARGVSVVVVVGAGVAGTAAALAAAREGASVTLLDGGTGASTLATGALDLVPWARQRAGEPLSDAAREVLDALGGFALPDSRARLVSIAGVVRAARGHDAALLDVEPLEGDAIGVARCLRPGWDADALAEGWTDASGGRARFLAIEARVLRRADERALPDPDFAERHDDDERLAWLAQRLREALRAPGAPAVAGLVLPPSLGVDRPRAAALSARVGVPCGEALAAPGGPSGLRFERARDRALRAAGVTQARARASAVAREDGVEATDRAWRVVAEDGATFEARAVVLAAGGLLGGGLDYAPSEARPPFRATIDAPVVIGAMGRPVEVPGSLFGLAPEQIAWPFAAGRLLERAGVLVDPEGRCTRRPGDLYAAGDLVADGPRTWLAALEEGARAGRAAARVRQT